MNYDLTNKEERKKFIKRANTLLKNKRINVALTDESNRTLNQNNYIHVLCRILATETGTTVNYAKQVYFKELANPDIFVVTTKDPLTNKMIKTVRSTSDLTIQEMQRAISTFIQWAAEQGYALPEATLSDDGIMTFSSQQDSDAFHQAEIQTSKQEIFV